MIDSLQRPVVAIHQPNFMPWAGWFAKAVCADTMILLDDVQFPKNSWVNRVRICADNRPFWLTIPVTFQFGQSISEVRIFRKFWGQKISKALDVTYRRAPYYEHYRQDLQRLLTVETDSLTAVNIPILHYLIRCLGGTCRVELSSHLQVDGKGDERLAKLVRAVGGKTYLSGTGARAYQDPGRFPQAGLELRILHLRPEPYPQRRETFLPGLSVIDLLVHLGPASREWIDRATEIRLPTAPDGECEGGGSGC